MGRVPYTVVKTLIRNENVKGLNPIQWRDISSADLFDDKKVVFFAFPGVFTRTY